jgi:anti-sigma B factor antagonist
MAMEVVEIRSGDVTILTLSGRLTYMQGDAILRSAIQRLLGDGQNKVLLDLGGVTYVDSAGLGELVSAQTDVRQAGGDLKLANLNGHQKQLLTMTRLHMIFETFDSPDTGVESFAVSPDA